MENIINQSPVVVFLWKNLESWPVDFVSKNIQQYGYIPNDFLSGQLKYANIIHPDDLERVLNEVDYYSKSHVLEFSQEYRILTKNGEIKWIDDRTWIRRDIQGNITHFQGIVMDITERKKTEAKLKESEELFRKIAENTFIGLNIIQNNKIIYSNEALTKINGYTIKEMKNMEPQEYIEMILPDYREIITKRIKKYQEENDGSVSYSEFPFHSKEGALKWVITNEKPIIYKNRTAVLTTIIDITEKKKIEEDLIESERKYRESYNRAEFYKDIFTHDINNILQSIQIANDFNELLLEINDLEKVKLNCERIKESVSRAARLIKNVKKLFQIEENKSVLQQLDVIDALKSSKAYIIKTSSHKEIEIKMDVPYEKIFINANELLHDLFENILINAINHNLNQKIEILIKVSKLKKENHNYIKIQIIDNGIGIEDKRKETIFDRASNINKSASGSGLGLSLVKKIVDGFRGEIWVENRIKEDYSKGCSFIILIPEA